MRLKAPMTALVLLGASTLFSCTALIDVGDYRDDGCDLDLRLTNFSAHSTDPFEVHLVREPSSSTAKANLVFRAVAEPLGAFDVDFFVPDLVPPRAAVDDPGYMIDFYADENNNGVYDDPNADHTWRLPDACGEVPHVFPHNINFDRLSAYREDAECAADPALCLDDLRSSEQTVLCGQFDDGALEVRVYRQTTTTASPDVEVNVPAGLFRLQTGRNRTDPLLLEGIVDSSLPHVLELWSDSDGDNAVESSDRLLSINVPDVEDAGACPVDEDGVLLDPCDLLTGSTSAVCWDSTSSVLVWAVAPENESVASLLSMQPWVTTHL